MIHKITRIMIGTTISALGTAMVLNSDLGSLALQALCKALCNWTTLPFWLINILVELSMIASFFIPLNL